MLPEPEMRYVQDHWVVESAPAGLADRIIMNALAHKQQRGFFSRVKRAIAMPEQGGYAMRGAFAVAACLMIAIIALELPLNSKTKYEKPMDQLVEETLWDNYTY